jgi:histidinol-phosphate aminotransferase
MSDPDQIIKLASNENPLGPSPKAIEAMRCALAIRAALFRWRRLYLREALADRLGLGAKILSSATAQTK